MDVIQKLLDKAKQPNNLPQDSPEADLLIALSEELDSALHKLEIADQKYILEHNRASGWFDSYNRQRDQKVELLVLVNNIKDLLGDDSDERSLPEIRREILSAIASALGSEALSAGTGSISLPPE
jgi:hypothetical protein